VNANLEIAAHSIMENQKKENWLTHYQTCQKVLLFHQFQKNKNISAVKSKIIIKTANKISQIITIIHKTTSVNSKIWCNLHR